MENVTLKKIVYTSISYDFLIESAESISLEIQQNTKLNPPKNPEDRTIMLSSEMTICEPDNNAINIKVKADTIFEFDTKPETYEKIVQKKCLPVIFTEFTKKIDEIMELLGYPRFNLKYEPSSFKSEEIN